MNKLTALRAVLLLVALPHLALGALAFAGLPGPTADWVGTLYGARDLEIVPSTRHLIRMLGAFMPAVGVMTLFAWRDPAGNRPIILGVCVLLVLRVSQRFLFAGEIHATFGVTTGKLVAQSLFYLAIAAALFVLLPRSEPAGGASASG